MRTSRNPMLRRTGWLAAALLGIVLVPAVASAQPMPGECASGFCGTPNNNGGGCGCGCGGSILVNNTDLGQTYSTSDDYDADGIEDDFDNCPFIPNRDQADSDGDGVGNLCDNCASTSNRTQADADGDGQGNACDSDGDGDNLPDTGDNCALVPNQGQADTDHDSQGDVCDSDKDGDGVPNATDNCPLVPNPDQTPMPGAACDADQDADGVPDSKDNCPSVYNPDQKDSDNDSTPERPLGDLCDGDQDNDSVANDNDNCPDVANPDQKDDDHDGLGNLCDNDGYCFHAAKNPAAKCLDPRNVFQVTSSKPLAELSTGDKFFLGIYSNRAAPPPEAPDATTAKTFGIKYSFAVTKRPEGSQAKLENPVGPAQVSDAYEYHFDDAKRPAFIPDLPGVYEITLAADLTEDDPKYPSARHAQDVISVMVKGEPKTDSAGCASVPPIVPPRAGALLGLSGLFLLGLVVLGRRRSSR